MVRNSILVITFLAIGGMVGFFFSPHPMAQSLITLALQKLAFKSLAVILLYWLARYVLDVRRHEILELIKNTDKPRPELGVAIYCTGLLCIALIVSLA